MNTYVIRREKAWAGPEELEATAARSKQVAEERVPAGHPLDPQLRDQRGGRHPRHRLHLPGDQRRGCAASTPQRVDMPADEVLEVADTVIIRPDPQPEAATGLALGRVSCENAGVATVERPASRQTHEVFNQPPPLEDYNLFDADRPLVEALRREGAEWAEGRTREIARDHRLAPDDPLGLRGEREEARSCGPTTATATGSTRSSSTAPGTN